MVERHVMIDIECLGTGDMPVVLSIGIMKFNPWADYREIPISQLPVSYTHLTLPTNREV